MINAAASQTFTPSPFADASNAVAERLEKVTQPLREKVTAVTTRLEAASRPVLKVIRGGREDSTTYLVGAGKDELKPLIPWDKIEEERIGRKIKASDFLSPANILRKMFSNVLYHTSDLDLGHIRQWLGNYTPSNLEEFKKAGAVIEQRYILTRDKIPLETWIIKHPESKNVKPLNVYFHGNASSNLNTFSERALKDFTAGNDIVLASYRGYSYNPGVPSQNGLSEDARAVIAHLIDEQKISSQNINVIAHSLGCAAALSGLEARNKEHSHESYGSIKLLAPFFSTTELLKDKFKFLPEAVLKKIFTKDTWDNSQRLSLLARKIKNLSISHGTSDMVINFKHSEKLAAIAKSLGIPVNLSILKNKGHGEESL